MAATTSPIKRRPFESRPSENAPSLPAQVVIPFETSAGVPERQWSFDDLLAVRQHESQRTAPIGFGRRLVVPKNPRGPRYNSPADEPLLLRDILRYTPQPTEPVMSESNDDQSLNFARWSLALFIVGVLVPIVSFLVVIFSGHAFKGGIPNGLEVAPWANATIILAFGTGAVCEAMALILGVKGRRHNSAQYGVTGSIVVIGCAIYIAFRVFLQR